MADSFGFELVPTADRRCSEIDSLVRGEVREDRRERSVRLLLILLFMVVVVVDDAGKTAEAGRVRG